jgi:glutathione S-transferase
MILVGQYGSPFVRRVGVSLRVLGFAHEHDTRSVFTNFDVMRRTNPLRRVPSLILDDGKVLLDPAAILDWLDQFVGPEQALVPAAGTRRRRVLRGVALATGAIDKPSAAAAERLIRPWPEWIGRCRIRAKR